MLKNFGQKLRKLRKEKGLTLVEVSQKTGVAQATLSRIETGTMIGTVESHEKIAEVLGVSLSELYSGTDSRLDDVSHLSRDTDRKITPLGKNVQIELLTTDNYKKKITPFLMTIQPQSNSPEEQNERGVEKFFYVIDGEIKIRLEEKECPLRAGESLYFDASLKHQVFNEKTAPAKILAAVSPSKI